MSFKTALFPHNAQCVIGEFYQEKCNEDLTSLFSGGPRTLIVIGLHM